MKMSKFVYVLVFILLIISCGSENGGGIDRDIEKFVTIENGIYGQVTKVNDIGNNNPSYAEGFTINIYKKDDELIKSNIVASATSTTFGFYEIELSGGSYNICSFFNRCNNLELGVDQSVRCDYEFSVGPGWDCGAVN